MSYQGRVNSDRYINAAKDGYLDILQEASKRHLNTPDEDGMTAAMWASRNGHLDALRLIVGRGGDVDRSDYLGLTPLHHAAEKGLLHVVTYLVNWGTNIYALDNDHHSAMDLASLHHRKEVVQYLDTLYEQQLRKNPKHAARLREDAFKRADRNIRRYEKLQEEAARRADKQHRKLASAIIQESEKNGEEYGRSHGKNFIKSLTLAIRGSKSLGKVPSPSGKSYSDIAGLSQTTGGRSNTMGWPVGRRRFSEELKAEGNKSDFKMTDVDDDTEKRRTSRSLSISGTTIPSMSSDVIYVSGHQPPGAEDDDGAVSRPAVYDVFHGRDRSTAKSHSDGAGFGEDNYLCDEEDEAETAPGIFNRPGFGKTAFLTGSNFLNTLPSFGGQPEEENTASSALDGSWVEVNGGERDIKDKAEMLEGDKHPSLLQGARDMPWDQDEVDTLDDDDEGTTTSALEIFLWSAGVEGYLHKFLQERVDMDVLVKMSDADLKEIGLPFGPRKRLLDTLKHRHRVLSVPKNITDTFL